MRQLIDWSRSQRAPASIAMAGVVGGSFLLALGVPLVGLALTSPKGPLWALGTYWLGSVPNASGLLAAVFGVLILVTLGTRVERSVGTARWLGVWAASTLVAGLGVVVGGHLFGPSGLMGPWPPIMALVMEWCLRNGATQVMLLGLIPMSARTLGLLIPVFVAVGVTGPLGTTLLLVALFYALYFLLRSRPELAAQRAAGHQTPERLKREAQYYDEVRRREKERAERDQLRKLLESSIQSDDEPKS